MKFINYTNDGRVVVQHAALILSKLDETDTLELHTMDNAIVLLKKDMTLVETRDVLQGMVRLARSMTLDALCNSDAEDKTPLVDESVDDEYEDSLPYDRRQRYWQDRFLPVSQSGICLRLRYELAGAGQQG